MQVMWSLSTIQRTVFQAGESKHVSRVTKQKTIFKFLSLYSPSVNLISQSYQNENWKTQKIYGSHSRSTINDPALWHSFRKSRSRNKEIIEISKLFINILCWKHKFWVFEKSELFVSLTLINLLLAWIVYINIP